LPQADLINLIQCVDAQTSAHAVHQLSSLLQKPLCSACWWQTTGKKTGLRVPSAHAHLRFRGNPIRKAGRRQKDALPSRAVCLCQSVIGAQQYFLSPFRLPFLLDNVLRLSCHARVTHDRTGMHTCTLISLSHFIHLRTLLPLLHVAQTSLSEARDLAVFLKSIQP